MTIDWRALYHNTFRVAQSEWPHCWLLIFSNITCKFKDSTFNFGFYNYDTPWLHKTWTQSRNLCLCRTQWFVPTTDNNGAKIVPCFAQIWAKRTRRANYDLLSRVYYAPCNLNWRVASLSDSICPECTKLHRHVPFLLSLNCYIPLQLM